MAADDTATRSRLLLAAFLTVTGVGHILRPEPFERLVPRWLPGSPAAWNRVATAAELASAALLAFRRTARLGGFAACATMAGVWPANIQAALDGGYRAFPGWLGSGVVAWVRVPLQVPLLWWAASIARRPEEAEM
jgi:uncharacterized membrane protein